MYGFVGRCISNTPVMAEIESYKISNFGIFAQFFYLKMLYVMMIICFALYRLHSYIS